jgi:hypothetical protein
MYVANSEPAIWQWEGGRAGVRERVLISGEPTRSEAGRYMERKYVLPREALLLWYLFASMSAIKWLCDGRPPQHSQTEGDRSIGSTNDSGPMKPGNRAEEKTLTIRPTSLDISMSSSEIWEAIDER